VTKDVGIYKENVTWERKRKGLSFFILLKNCHSVQSRQKRIANSTLLFAYR
jgi:hypothetical protein